MKCNCDGCGRPACVTWGDSFSTCLAHFYVDGNEKSGAVVSDEDAFRRQRRKTEDVFVDAVVNELRDDLEQALERVKSRAKRIEKVASKAAAKEISLSSSSSSSSSSAAAASQTLIRSLGGVTEEEEKLFMWQLDVLKGKKAKSGNSSSLLSSTRPPAAKPQFSVSKPSHDRKVPTLRGDELDGVTVEIPGEEKRRKTAARLANAILPESNPAESQRLTAGCLGVEIEKAAIKIFKEDKKGYAGALRKLLAHLRNEKNEELRQKLLSKSLSPEELLSLDEDALDPESAKRLKAAKTRVLEDAKVVDVEEAFSQKRIVDNVECPNCQNKEQNVLMTLNSTRESTKVEVWGSKETQEKVKERFKCSKCGHVWVDDD